MASAQGKVNQVNPTVLFDGQDELPAMSKIGQLFTADFKHRLLLAGRMWRLTVGTLPADGDVTQVTGGGGTSTLELEQPEILVGVDEGFSLMVVEVDLSIETDNDAPDDYMRSLIIADTTQSPPVSLTGQIETPANLLDGAGAFPGRAYSAVTADIVDPVVSSILQYRTALNTVELVLNGTATNITVGAVGSMHTHYEPAVPDILKGPCQFAVYWGGTIATKGLATAVFAAVPTSWFPQV